MIWFLLVLLGLSLGSFFNVCIHRIPRGESIATPPSHCPHCGKRIRACDNIPVLSYILLRGRCRSCRRPISPRYMAVEVATALLFVVVFAQFGFTWSSLNALVFVCMLVVMALIDLEHRIIPFRLSVPGLVLGLAGSLLPPGRLTDALIGAAVGAAFICLAWLLWRYVLFSVFRRFGIDQREGMGGGDLPFAAMIGAFLGWRSLVVALFAGVIAGVIVGLILRWAGRTKGGQQIPFGPFLAIGALVGLFFGSVVFGWYVDSILH